MIKTCPECRQPFKTRKSARTYCGQECYDSKRRRAPGPTTFKAGIVPANKVPVGTVRIRRRYNTTDGPRAWVKVAEPNVWRLRAQITWERERGPIPRGMLVHHHSRDTLDDSITNLRLVSRADHLREHRPEFEDKRAEAATSARWPHRIDP